MKYKTGLVIGRFQPFHNGHAYLVKKALEFTDQLIIGIGSSNRKNKDNPIRYRRRLDMITLFLKKEKLESRIKNIVPIPDMPDDDEWYSETLKRTGNVDVVFGNNDWVNGIYRKFKIPVIEVDYHKRETLEGKKIRELLRTEQKWEERVPEYLAGKIRKTIPHKKKLKARKISKA
jgi:nicotinamide-nucleotide adenylyltransferase